ncbi:MAG: hypothetical protein RLZZ232_2361 [Planctomycetota bacterium]|jgi:aminoglycoside phosphotransferase family enzyme/predicted kinase
MQDITRQILEFLSRPEAYAHHPASVRCVQTHASWVFLASPYVYKVKKPVDFGFLNFTTLERRYQNCLRELQLNRRLAEDVYLDVEAICRIDGRWVLTTEPQGEVFEWCVRMRELDPREFLRQRLLDSVVTPADVRRVAERLLAFYESQPPLPLEESRAATERLHTFAADNLRVATQFAGQSITAHGLAALAEYNRIFELTHATLLQSRSQLGWIRDAHGDLHLDHVHLSGDAVRIYDCLEFNAELRHIDVACDVAFLIMDLDFHGRHDLAEILKARLQESWRDPALTQLLCYYQCYRGCVRGKVESLHSVTETAADPERQAAIALARRYFQLAVGYALSGTAPCVLVCCGRIATGKSALAEFLSQETGWPLYSSDRLRKTLANVELNYRGTAEERATLYGSAMTEQVYSELSHQAVWHFRRGHSVILDATYSDRQHRTSLRQSVTTAGGSLMWVEATADDAVVRARLRRREHESHVISDAREADFEMLTSKYNAPMEIPESALLRISTDGEQQQTCTELLRTLVSRNARSGGP